MGLGSMLFAFEVTLVCGFPWLYCHHLNKFLGVWLLEYSGKRLGVWLLEYMPKCMAARLNTWV
jgi:hypothetical protein